MSREWRVMIIDGQGREKSLYSPGLSEEHAQAEVERLSYVQPKATVWTESREVGPWERAAASGEGSDDGG